MSSISSIKLRKSLGEYAKCPFFLNPEAEQLSKFAQAIHTAAG